MDGLQRLRHGDQTAVRKQLFRVIFLREPILYKGLTHRLAEGLIGEPLSQRIFRNQAVGLSFVFFRRKISGLFHDKLVSAALYRTVEDVKSPLLQFLFQKGHIEKGKLQGSRPVRDIHIQDTQLPNLLFVWDSGYGRADRTDFTGGQPVDPHRFPEDFIISRTGSQQISHRLNAQFLKQLLCLFSNALQLNDRGILFHVC